MTSVGRLLQLVCVLTLALAEQGTPTVLNATETHQYFTSPNYPYDYPKSQDLGWHIFTDLPGKGIEIDVVDSRVEFTTACAFDCVRIYDGSSTRALLIEKFCGHSKPRVKSSGPHMYVRFYTDTTNEYKGFRIRYSASLPAPKRSPVNVNVGLIVGLVFMGILVCSIICCIIRCVVR